MSVKHLLKDFILPTQIMKVKENTEENQAVVSLQTFERGFANTVGNSLRRALLSSIQGFSVTAVCITLFSKDGGQKFVTSEYDVIDGIVEDTMDVLDAIKNMKFVVSDDNITNFTLEGKCVGNSLFTMEVFETAGVTILNSHDILLTSTTDVDILIRLEVELGRGYVPAEQNEKRINEENIILIDALFSPILNATYDVESVRIGHRSDYEKLNIKVETDGTIEPVDAISQSAKIIKDIVSVLINFDEYIVDVAPVEDETVVELDKKFNIPIEDLELSQRSSNCFKAANITLIRDLVKMSEREIENLPNFGKKCMDEVKEKLKELELSFSMDVDG